jgi:Type I phosphodiesterase / nucleotide pyrophosphatase
MQRPSEPQAQTSCLVCLATLCLVLAAADVSAQVQRMVVVKIDGLSPRVLQNYLSRTRGPRSRLPWIEYVFGRKGVWLDNFYSRGLSLSAPSWSLLDTGRHLEIRGNVEYDRYTLQAYDYLNFFPQYFKSLGGDRDMPGVELLDEYGVPLLVDRFPAGAAYQGGQLLQRDVRWSDTSGGTLKRALSVGAVRDFLDEWQVGWSWQQSWNRENEELLVAGLKNPSVRYLELFSGEFDHVAHLTNDPVSQFQAIEAIDALVGRIWNAIQQSPLADSTALVLVSDHGMNTSPEIISQGYNFVDWFTSRAGGTQHVLTNRHPLQEFKIKGLDIFVEKVVTPSPESSYLASSGEQYPTVMLDLDGNERASIGLRNNTLNRLHVLLDQLIRKKVNGLVRAAALTAFFETLDAVREEWAEDLEGLKGELAELNERIDLQQQKVSSLPKTWTKDQIARGMDREARREARRLDLWRDDLTQYSQYVATVNRLLDLTRDRFDPGKFKISDLIPPFSFGPANSLWDVQHYVTDVGSDGLVLDSRDQLDWERSFRTTNYVPALTRIAVRNNVQADVDPRPVDFTAMRVPFEGQDAVWLYRDEEHQALVRSRDGMVHYEPIARLKAREDGSIAFDRPGWSSGFPLEIFEDPRLAIPETERREWLSAWHSEREWLTAVHKTRYSNGIIGVTEALLGSTPATPYLERKRRLRRTELLVVAKAHWNFNARAFNPGGNHGSFYRESTHSVLLLAGGRSTGLPSGLHVETPYDSLSFAPTILALMGRAEPDLPGPIIEELIATDR